jgi:polar amino acid transport system substrate-binding protein
MMPGFAFGLDVTATTARPNSDSGNEIMGGTETRVNWEAQADPNESLTQLVLDYPAGSVVPATGVKVTGLSGLDRISLNESITAVDDDTIQIDFANPTDPGLLIRVEASKVVLPTDGGDLTISGKATLQDGSQEDLETSPAIHVVSVTPSEQLSSWLSEQGWVQAWNSNSFLHMFLDPSIIVTSLPEVFFGWLLALAMVVCSFPIAIVIGLLLCFLRISPWRIVRAIGSLYVNVVRGTPLFLQIYIAFFGLPLMGIKPPDVLLAVIVMSMNSAAYLCEIFRAGIESIHSGQFEASRSLGMNAVQTMFFVIIPQAVRRVIPTMTSEFILLYKDTSLFASVGVLEIIMHAKSLTAITGNMTPYIVAAFFYLLVTLPLTKFVGKLEKRMDDPSHGRKRKARAANADDTDDEIAQEKSAGTASVTAAEAENESTQDTLPFLDSEHAPIANGGTPQLGEAR